MSGVLKWTVQILVSGNDSNLLGVLKLGSGSGEAISEACVLGVYKSE